MSVLKPNRGLAEPQFIQTARILEITTIKKCISFPKRYTFFLTLYIAYSGWVIYRSVMKANSIYPVNAHEVQVRRDHFANARAELYNLTSQIGIADEVFGLNEKTMLEWTALIDKEISLVNGIMKKDRSRYKNIMPEEISEENPDE